MNNKQRKVYDQLYKDPVQADIKWSDIENLLVSLGAVKSEGNGSRVRIILNNERAVFHRPHPDGNTDKGAIKAVRRFLENAGVKKDDEL